MPELWFRTSLLVFCEQIFALAFLFFLLPMYCLDR
jgi:hypothetical protein